MNLENICSIVQEIEVTGFFYYKEIAKKYEHISIQENNIKLFKASEKIFGLSKECLRDSICLN